MIERISFYSRPFAGSKVFFHKNLYLSFNNSQRAIGTRVFHIHLDNIQTWNNA